MSWKRHLTPVPQSTKLQAALARNSRNADANAISGSGSKFSSYLPQVYDGPPNRIERYSQYDNMDQDPEVNYALDTIADFCTQIEEKEDNVFQIVFHDEATDAEVDILNELLRKWCRINKFKQRIWRIFRNTIIYGDQFFLRDPETFKLFWINHEKVDRIVVDESDGKEPDLYIVKDVDLNLQTLVGTLPTKNDGRGLSSWAGLSSTSFGSGAISKTSYMPTTGGSRFEVDQSSIVVDAAHIVHLSMSEGLDSNWPFGTSVLEPIFKPYKQKELLEDAVIIYRIQRAPERRIFHIDVGNAPPHRAMEFVTRIKNEIHQRRIPSKTGGGSNIIDAAYNPLCLDMNTTVPLLDGRTLTITQLAEEYQNGKENWTYSCDPITGKIVPGNITWAGTTRKNTQVIKLTFDNGSTLTCTPDHKIPVLGKGFVEAQYLTSDDSLISFNTQEKSLVSSNNDRTYTQIYDHAIQDWVYSHRMVGNFFREIGKHQEFTYLNENVGKHKTVVHHKDFNRYNNDPRNLQWMNHQDHIKYHQDQNFWNKITEEESARIKNKISQTNKENWKSLSEDDKKIKIRHIQTAQKKSVWLRLNDLQFKEKYAKNFGESRKRLITNNPELKTKITKHLTNWQVTCPNQKKVLTQKMLQRVVDVVKLHNTNRLETAKLLENDQILLNEIQEANPRFNKTNYKINDHKFTVTNLDYLIEHFGYKGWKDFKKKIPQYNHRIVSIEWLAETQDVGTITIDGKERWHSYHTFPVNNSIFVKNSMIEDYFFPVTADGRGSRVETLPGGENLGEIDDLKYFNSKMLKGLKVPPMYMPGHTEEMGGSAVYNDGRIGSAFIQEFKFNKHCQRLQNLLNSEFDREFKLYLEFKGMQIEHDIFEISLQEPTSFSRYRQIELDAAQINIFQPLAEVKYLSKRFMLKRFLNLTEDELIENETMWKEENADLVKGATGSVPSDETGVSLSNVGVRPAPAMDGGEGMEPEMDDMPDESPISGGEAGMEGGEMPAEGGDLEL